MGYSKELLKNVHRIVIKVGTSTLTYENGLLNFQRIESLVRQIADIHNRGYEVILVSSGAIGAGMGKLGLKNRPKTIPEKQAAAAIGQGFLMQMYEKFFSEYGQIVAQILITKDDMEDTKRVKNAKNTFDKLIEQRVIPIVNENDAIATEEIKFGDNDTLSAVVSKLTSADLLILLSDIDGMYDCNPNNNPNAKLISHIKEITPQIENAADDSDSSLGTGGMITKLNAGKIVTSYGAAMFIVNGGTKNIIQSVIDGDEVGTLFTP